MVLVISQETFDNAVKENIDEFQMSPEEAIRDAINQFKAQGVDLTNIVTSASPEDNDTERLKNIVDQLEKLIQEGSVDSEELTNTLNSLKAECDIDIAHRVLAGKLNAYGLLVDLGKNLSENEPISAVLITLTALMTGQPDLLEDRGIELLLSLLRVENSNLQRQTLIWTRQSIIKHEFNRQNVMEAGIAPLIVGILSNESSSPNVVQEACKVSRALVLDDDIRVPYGKAHEHARVLAGDYEILDILTSLLSRFKADRSTLFEILCTMTALTVRHEFCLAVYKAGGLQLVLDILVSFPENEKLVRQSMKLLKGLAGNDDVKKHIVDAGVLSVIISSMTRHEASPTVASSACSLISALTLRSTYSSSKAHEVGVEHIIVQTMKVHSENADVIRMASSAIRNMVSRNKELCEPFLKLGVAELLAEALEKHKSKCEANVKGALRDLGCPVELQEQWKGKSNVPLVQN